MVLKLYRIYIKPNQLMDIVALTVLWYLDLFEIHYILKGNLIIHTNIEFEGRKCIILRLLLNVFKLL